MKEGPDISIVAALIGNPACANMLMALLAGPALTATELAQEAGLKPSTVSGHLAKLKGAGLIAIERQGRHRYFRLADRDVANALEGLMPVAARAGHLRVRTGPRDPELRRARSCYDHLAGDLAVTMFDRFVERKLLSGRHENLRVTDEGRRYFAKAGIDIGALDNGRRPLCRPCLDWSERRMHLGGARHPSAHRRARLGGKGPQQPRGAVFPHRRSPGARLALSLKTHIFHSIRAMHRVTFAAHQDSARLRAKSLSQA